MQKSDYSIGLFLCFVKIYISLIFVHIITYNKMEKRTKNILIVTGVLALAGLSLGLYVYIKKKNNDSWRLIKLPYGSKKNRKIVLVKSN